MCSICYTQASERKSDTLFQEINTHKRTVPTVEIGLAGLFLPT